MHYSVNQGALKVVREILDRKEELNCGVTEDKSGSTLVDAGVGCAGSSELGRLIGETCLGGLGAARLTRMFIGDLDLPAIIVSVEQPKIATLGSQYAGWSIRVGKYYASGSGPARALARFETGLFDAIAYQDTSKKSVIILESRNLPTKEATEYIAERCGIAPSNLYCIIVPAASIAGLVERSSRIIGTGLYKAYRIGFDPDRIRRGHGIAPIAPLIRHENRAMSVSHDCILYGGRAFYHVRKDMDDLQETVDRLPSSTSAQYGQPFYDLFEGFDFEISRIDPLLLGPAEVTFNHIETGKVYHAGGLNPCILRKSFGL
jgi:methenyltetrahydromethanopterin cyclohydrolase